MKRVANSGVCGPANFYSCINTQILEFQKAGYVLIRKNPSVNLELVASINSEVLNYFNNIELSLRYRIWRFFNSVGTPKKRHSIPLPLTPLVRELLNTSIGYIHPFLRSQLSVDAPLVIL